MANIQTYNFKNPVKNGDTFNGAEYETIVDGAAEDLTNVSLLCEFREDSKTGDLAVRLTDGNGITITDAVNGLFQIDPIQEIDWGVGTYYYDIQFIYPTKNRTWVEGKLLISQDVSKA